jgi:type I restriction enzyme M protein
MTQPYTELKYDTTKTKIWCPLKGEYRKATPEEIVRQEYILHLHTHYGYALAQMDQERKTQHGRHSVRADIVIWESTGAN